MSLESAQVMEFIKIPSKAQRPEIIDQLWSRRKQLNDIFWDKTKSAKERNAVFDESNAISNYLGAKTIQYKIKEPGQGGGRRVITAADREQNCNSLEAYLKNKGLWSELEPAHQALILSNAWGAP